MSDKKRRSPWDLFEELFGEIHERMDRMLEDLLEPFRRGEPSWNIEHRCLTPLADTYETPDEVVVTVDLPCVDRKEDIQLSVTSDQVELQAKMRKAVRFERWGTVQRDAEFDTFRKTIKLPAKIRTEDSKAKFEKGILEIRLPKQIERFRIDIEGE